MRVRKLTVDDVKWELYVEQDDIPVRGNALASGDDDEDKRVEDEILQRLDSGDVWAWAAVELRGSYRGMSASEYLGGCCYRDEADFRDSEYFQEMELEVMRALQLKIEHLAEGVINA